ncbi:GGDEF domain-containing phosphodiesterase [Chrysiogenes arsenatis]|uniref:GGDEF domain-containing phosphodiesterase n=1 Tax=Chrysiogenes arsenatis TaxID=309797 RepID=UPI0003F649D4|nr:GGDEF domain-containing phosphodiesterase [Chrysiogenes arsenatis]
MKYRSKIALPVAIIFAIYFLFVVLGVALLHPELFNFIHMVSFAMVTFVAWAILSFVLHRMSVVPILQMTHALEHLNSEKLTQLKQHDDEWKTLALSMEQYFQQTRFTNKYTQAIDDNFIVSKADPQGVITYANDQFCKRSGYSREELVGQPHRIVRHPDTPSHVFSAMWKKLKNGETWSGVTKNRAKSGEAYYVKSLIIPITDEHNQLVEYTSIRSDVTDLFQQMDVILRQTTDSLTDLPNKVQLLEDLELLDNVALMLVNIDGFRSINESYGQKNGDRVIAEVARQVSVLIGSAGRLYRVVGDEFAIIVDQCELHVECYCNVEMLASSIIEHFQSQPIRIGDNELHLTVKVSAAQGQAAYHNADMAMHYAKVHTLSFVDYDNNQQIQSELQRALEVTAMVREALRKGAIIPYGQKIFATASGGEYRIEALMRILSNDGTVIAPYVFLEQAKRSKLYGKLSAAMMEKLFAYFRQNQQKFSINITFDDINNESIVEMIFQYANDPVFQGRIILELVESQSFIESPEVESFIQRAKEAGCLIAIDDFGSGYSNFEYILRMQADIVKIDGSLIKNMDCDQHSHAIVRAITRLARELGLRTVAEFVHSAEVERAARELGIDYLQGFHLHVPEALTDLK